MILLPNCRCCRECACTLPEIPFGSSAHTILTFHFLGGASVSVCKDSPGSLLVNNPGLCEYYCDYDVSSDYGSNCIVRVWYRVSGSDCGCDDTGVGCTYSITGYAAGGASCSLTGITHTTTECAA